jgi:hypothetical protein
MTMLAEIGEDARFFALLFEALERALKVLVVMDYDFRQILLPPLVAFARRIWDRPINVPDIRRVVKLRKPRSDMKLSGRNFAMVRQRTPGLAGALSAIPLWTQHKNSTTVIFPIQEGAQ